MLQVLPQQVTGAMGHNGVVPAIVLISSLLLVGCDAGASDEAEAGSAAAPISGLQQITTPAATGSAEPNLTTTADGAVLLSWIEPAADGGHALRFATLQDTTWSVPRTIASGRDWFVNWADFPSVRALDDGTLTAHWLQRNGDGTYAYGVRIARSDDGGSTWGAPITPHRDSTQAEHGFVTLYDAGSANVGAVWLDGRKYAAGQEEMTLRHAEIGPDGDLTNEIELDARVCDCCQTDMATSGDDLLVFYRDRSDDEVRDIAMVRISDGAASTPTRVHADNWRIEACPVNGPAADADGSLVVVAWFAAPADSGRVLVAFSENGGASFNEPVRVDNGAPAGRVDVTLVNGDEALVSWLERVDGAAEVRARRVTRAGQAGPPATITRTGDQRASGFPRMTRTGDRIVFAWTDAGPAGTGLRSAVAALR